MYSHWRRGRYIVLGLLCFSIGVVVGLLAQRRILTPASDHKTPSVVRIQTLMRASLAGESLTSRWRNPNFRLEKQDIPLAREFVFAVPDGSAFHLLLNIRKLDLEIYSQIPDLIKALVLVGGLSLAHDSDDWGDLSDPTSTGEAGTGLLAVGKTALPILVAFMDDDTRIGSAYGEVQAFNDQTHARRKDLVFKYLSLILSRQPFYNRDPEARDKAIEKLKSEVRVIIEKQADE